MYCFKCNSICCKKIIESVLVDICSNCHCIFLHKTELEQIILKNSKTKPMTLMAQGYVESRKENNKPYCAGTCPNCCGKIHKGTLYGYNVLKCDSCEGTIIDIIDFNTIVEKKSKWYSIMFDKIKGWFK